MTDKQIIIDGEKENCKILFDCYHIDDSEAYRMIRNGVKITPENAPFDDFELRLISNENSVYGFTSLCKRNKNNDEWEYMGFGHSGAASVVTALLKELSRKEQECEELKKIIDEAKNSKLDLNSFFAIEATVGEYQLELDQLKAEVKSKTKYIQEQRDIINQYSKEIEMYKKCQGKRASKREEELKAENEELKQQHQADKGLITSTGKMNYQLLQEYDKLKTVLTEIKEIAEKQCVCGVDCIDMKQILQKISEVEDG